VQSPKKTARLPITLFSAIYSLSLQKMVHVSMHSTYYSTPQTHDVDAQSKHTTTTLDMHNRVD